MSHLRPHSTLSLSWRFVEPGISLLTLGDEESWRRKLLSTFSNRLLRDWDTATQEVSCIVISSWIISCSLRKETSRSATLEWVSSWSLASHLRNNVELLLTLLQRFLRAMAMKDSRVMFGALVSFYMPCFMEQYPSKQAIWQNCKGKSAKANPLSKMRSHQRVSIYCRVSWKRIQARGSQSLRFWDTPGCRISPRTVNLVWYFLTSFVVSVFTDQEKEKTD